MAIDEKIDTLRRITKIKQNEAIRREFRPYFILKLCLHIANFTTFFVILRRVSVFSTIAIVKLFVTNFFSEVGSKFGQDGQIPISREFFKNCHMQINFCEKFSNSFLFLLLRRFRLEMERETKPLKRTYFETCNTSCSNISEISRTGSSLGLLNE